MVEPGGQEYLGATTSGQVKQYASYYPYGLRITASTVALSGGSSTNEDLFNGKELTDAFGLGWYHYGARFYDVATARWTTMDPADEFHSPYVYVGGDPVNLVDPDGRQTANAQTAHIQRAWDDAMNQLYYLWYGAVEKPVGDAADAARWGARVLGKVTGASAAVKGPRDFADGIDLMFNAYLHGNTTQALSGADLALQGIGNISGFGENVSGLASIVVPPARATYGLFSASSSVIDFTRTGVNYWQYSRGEMPRIEFFRRLGLSAVNTYAPGRLNVRPTEGLTEEQKELMVKWTTDQIDTLTEPPNEQ